MGIPYSFTQLNEWWFHKKDVIPTVLHSWKANFLRFYTAKKPFPYGFTQLNDCYFAESMCIPYTFTQLFKVRMSSYLLIPFPTLLHS